MIGSSFADVVRKAQKHQSKSQSSNHTTSERGWIDESPSKINAYYSSSATSSPLSLFPEEISPSSNRRMPFRPRPLTNHAAGTSSAPTRREPDSAPSSEASDPENLRTALSNRLVNKVLHEVQKSIGATSSPSSSSGTESSKKRTLAEEPQMRKVETDISLHTASLGRDSRLSSKTSLAHDDDRSSDTERLQFTTAYAEAIEKAIQIISRNLDELGSRVATLEQRDDDFNTRLIDTDTACAQLSQKLETVTSLQPLHAGIESLQQSILSIQEQLGHIRHGVEVTTAQSSTQMAKWMEISMKQRDELLDRLAHCERMCELNLRTAPAPPLPQNIVKKPDPAYRAPSPAPPLRMTDTLIQIETAKSENSEAMSHLSNGERPPPDRMHGRRWSIQKNALTSLTSSTAPTKSSFSQSQQMRILDEEWGDESSGVSEQSGGLLIPDKVSSPCLTHDALDSGAKRGANRLLRSKSGAKGCPSWENHLSFVSILQERKNESEKSRLS